MDRDIHPRRQNRYSLKSNLDEDETLLLLMEILDEVEEFFLRDFFADIFSDKMKYKISLKDSLQEKNITTRKTKFLWKCKSQGVVLESVCP